jgi:hypothetical protein
MSPQTQRWNMKVHEQQWHKNNQEMLKVEDAYYDGDAVYSEYSKAICALLKDPVSLGFVGGSSNHGHQR